MSGRSESSARASGDFSGRWDLSRLRRRVTERVSRRAPSSGCVLPAKRSSGVSARESAPSPILDFGRRNLSWASQKNVGREGGGMVSLRLGVGVLMACGACGDANSGSEGNVVTSPGQGASAMDGATGDAQIPHDATETDAGHPEAGPADAPTAAPPPVTWSRIYQTLLVNQSYPSNCTGASCHD